MRARGAAEPAGERVGLTREQVVRAALDLLDDVGLGGLSMRGLAERLGVKAASLYWHLRDKDQLLDLLSEAILAEVPEPAPGPWRPALDAFAHGYRHVLLAHRDAARVVAGFQSGPAALRRYERLIATLLAAGFEPSDAADASVLLFGQYVPAFVADETDGAPRAAGGPGDDFGAPLEAVERGELRIGGGASELVIRADPDLGALFTARFEGRPPRIDAVRGVVRIGTARGGDVALSTAVPWDVEVSGGARRLSVGLDGARVRSLVVGGGASEVAITLGQPEGTVPVRFGGGARNVSIQRPPGTACRVRIRSGASRLALDDLYFGSVGGETRWQSPDFAAAAHRYDIEVTGGVSRLTIGAGEEVPPVDPVGSEARGSLVGVSADEHPSVAAVADRLAAPDWDARFRFGLQVLLDGLERRLAAPAGPAEG
jgi:TetR/AcrR family tetracycline transcriptional repressor